MIRRGEVLLNLRRENIFGASRKPRSNGGNLGGQGSGRRNQKPKVEIRALALAMKLHGLTYAEVGAKLGVSRQRAQQLIRPPQAIWVEVRNRATGKCQKCGIKTEKGHVHHKKSTGITAENFNDLANLLYLCVSCHRSEHERTGGGGGWNEARYVAHLEQTAKELREALADHGLKPGG
jgi:HNH endonuclease/Homeodomain-like domain-containing protein